MASGQVISSLLIEIGVSTPDAEKASANIDKVKGSAKKLKDEGGGFVKDFTSEFSKMFVITAGDLASFAKAVPQALIAAAKQVFNFVDQTTEAVAKISHDAKASGLGVEEFQRLGKAAEKSGANSEVLGKSVRKLNAQLLEAAAGGGQGFTEALGDVGLNLEDLKGKSATEQLGIIGDALNGVTDKAKRSALSAKLLGEEGGPQLATLLSKGSKGIRELADNAEGMISAETIRKSQAFQLQMKEFENVLMGVKATIATALAPTIQSLIGIVQDWLKENEAFIEQDLPVIIDQLAASFEALYGFVEQSTEAFRELAEVTSLLNMDVAKSVPAWDSIAKSLLSIRNPIKDVADVIRILLDQIERLINKVPQLEVLAGRVGYNAKERREGKQKSRQESADEERRGREAINAANQLAAQKGAEAQLDSILQNNVRIKVVSTAKPGKKFSEAQKTLLRNANISDSEISTLEDRNVARAPKGTGGRGSKAPKPEAVAAEAVLAQMESRTLLGQALSKLGSSYIDQLPGLKRMQTGEEAYKPEVVMTINNYNFDNDIIIKGEADPLATAKQVATAIKQEFNMRLSKVGLASQVNVER